MPNHIEFEGETRAAKLEFSSKLTAQLQLRLLCSTGSKNERLKRLQEALFLKKNTSFSGTQLKGMKSVRTAS